MSSSAGPFVVTFKYNDGTFIHVLARDEVS